MVRPPAGGPGPGRAAEEEAVGVGGGARAAERRGEQAEETRRSVWAGADTRDPLAYSGQRSDAVQTTCV